MSTPHVIRCSGCHEYFTYIEGIVEKCQNCGMEYTNLRRPKSEKHLSGEDGSEKL